MADFWEMLKGALSGAGTGTLAAPGWGTAFGALAGGAAGALGQGFLTPNKPQETKMQATQRELIDQLIQGIRGQGPFADLFSSDQDTFNRSFLEPAKQMWSGQIAPSITEQFTASGHGGDTSLQDALARSGVDMDTLLNQQYGQFQQNAMNRQMSGIGGILGYGPGAQNQPSRGDIVRESMSGYLASPQFGKGTQQVFETIFNKKPNGV